MSKVTLVNHSSLLITLNNNKTTILTDFWNESPAFGSWLPSALPFFNPTYLASLSYEKNFFLAISHAHDDHIDDYFLKKYFNKDVKIIISEYPSPSLRNRIKKMGFNNVISINQEIEKIDNFEVVSIFDPQISGDDSGLAFRDNKYCIHHGNDNWFLMKENNINLLKKFKGDRVMLYASQTNTASGHPITYPQYDKETKDEIKKKVKDMVIAGLKNSQELSADYFLPYAGYSKSYVKNQDYHNMVVSPIYQNLLDLIKNEENLKHERMLNIFCGGTVDLNDGKVTYPFPITPENVFNTTDKYLKEEKIINKCDTFREDFQNDNVELDKVEYYLQKFNEFVNNFLKKNSSFYPSIIGKKLKFTICEKDNISKKLFSKCMEIGSGAFIENIDEPNKEFLIPSNLFRALIDHKIVFENLYTGYQAKVYRHPPNVYNRDIIMYLDMFGYVYAKKKISI